MEVAQRHQFVMSDIRGPVSGAITNVRADVQSLSFYEQSISSVLMPNKIK